MAYLIKEIQFTGPLGNISAYRMKGSDKIVLRTKGGPSKKKIATSPRFDMTRRNHSEFDRRAKGSKIVLRALHPLSHVADHRVLATMNALLKQIQVLDTTSELGKRDIFLSRRRALLEGYSFNRNHPFDSTLLAPVHADILPDASAIRVILPSVVPGVNFRPSQQFPFYSFVVTAGFVPDMMWSDNGYRDAADAMTSTHKATEWLSVRSTSPGRTLELSLSPRAFDLDQTLVVGIGIQYGVVGQNAEIMPVRYGCAKILAVK